MTADQITFQAQQGSAGAITTVATSLSPTETRTWHQFLDPFLHAGRPLSRGYLDFGTRAAAIRWFGDAGQPLVWQYAHAFVSERGGLTATQALELPGLNPAALPKGKLVAVEIPTPGPRHEPIAALARSAAARPVLVLLLAHVLWGERRIVMPWQEPSLPEAALWGLIGILEIIREPQRLSYLSYASGSLGPDALPGTFVSFQPGTRPGQPDSGFLRLATLLAERFADSPDALRQEVARHGVDVAADRPAKINRLLALLPTAQPKATSDQWIPIATSAPKATPPPRATATTAEQDVAGEKPSAPAEAGTQNKPRQAGQVVVCPICLGDITDWNTQSPWEWDPAPGKYTELVIPPGLSELQRAPYLRHAYIRCTAQQESAGQQEDDPHYLPANYGRFGRPVVLGFVGLSMAGKSHLLSAMVAGIVGGELRKGYHVSHDPLDQARHQTFLDSHVNPLLQEDKVLPGTGQTDVLEFADAFLMNDQSGQPRPVAFFDLAGGDLASLRKKKATNFLYMADGLFFVVDPVRLNDRWVEDKTFSNVLDIVRERPRPDPVSAAIVLTKADTLRFEEPVTRWLRYEPDLEPLNATQILRESADVYAYLESRNALALAAPYEKCAKATLHVASATGGNGEERNTVYSRGVRPRRVMRPLAAMLAMTGVLTGPEAEKVGI
ncbi:MAG: hypothetical protein ACLPKE_07105 [Streptosporangiaceae bacterium]